MEIKIGLEDVIIVGAGIELHETIYKLIRKLSEHPKYMGLNITEDMIVDSSVELSERLFVSIKRILLEGLEARKHGVTIDFSDMARVVITEAARNIGENV